jgi:hypothetical protein
VDLKTLGFLFRRNQFGNADAQRIREVTQGCNRGIAALLLDLDNHPLADKGPFCQGFQGKTAFLSMPNQVVRNSFNDFTLSAGKHYLAPCSAV